MNPVSPRAVVICVTVGTHQQPFQRLLDAVSELPADELVVQFGYGSPPPGVARASAFLSFSETLEYVSQADAVVTHAGVGSILCARRVGHVPIVVPRLRRCGEHVDDHQAELTRALAAEGLVVPVWDTDRLSEALDPMPRRAPSPSSNGRLQRAVREALRSEMAGEPDVLVLCYHGISERWPADTAVRPDRFEEQLSRLVDRGYQGSTFTDLLTAPPGGRSLAVTFDDAPRSVLTLALPIMAKLGLPGTVFVPTAFPGAGRPMAWPGQEQWAGTEHEHELACMSWDELRELAERGWEIGSHTRSHPHLTSLDDEQLQNELRGSRDDCEERLGRPCRSLAYPYSDFDARVVRAAREAGYLVAGSVPQAPAAPLPLQWPRVGVYRDDSVPRLAARIWRRRSLNGSRVEPALAAALRTARRMRPH